MTEYHLASSCNKCGGENDIKEFRAKHEKSAAGSTMGTLGDILKTKLAEKGKK